jgi:hypothetical protein
MTDDVDAAYRITPRYALLAGAAAGVGAALVAIGILASTGNGQLFAIGAGAAGLLLGLLYLASPVRQLEIAVSAAAIAVRRRGEVRLSIPWSEVDTVLVSDSGLYLWTGDPARSLLVTGPGIPGPYAVDRREALIDDITARSPDGTVERVDDLLLAYRALVSDKS